jgi:glutaminyl-peptide cyclotransferase
MRTDFAIEHRRLVAGLGRFLLTALLLLSAGSALAGDPVPTFDGDQAFTWLVAQCDIGPRTPGSEGNARLRGIIKAHAAACGLRAVELCFSSPNPMGEGPVDLCNIVVSTPGRGSDRLWLGAHFDTRPVSDLDPDPARRHEPLVGANDGASGVAVLLHLMELFAQRMPERGVDLLFLDGEDSGSSGKPLEYCLGSAHLARTWQDFGSPLAGPEPAGVIILDMVGDADLSIPMEQYSLQYSPDLLHHIYERAAALGLPAFEPVRGPAVYDDHVPFIQAGLPAVDLIDFDYPQWHTTADTPAACSPASLGQVGTLMVDLIYNP